MSNPIIRYIDIDNFKTFGSDIHIDISNPTVLIGPNNAGKTSVIQALALWSLGVKEWYSKKGKSVSTANTLSRTPEKYSAGINRLNILDVPVSETRYLWNKLKVRSANKPVQIVINIGIEIDEKVVDCRFIFTERDQEIIYCKPCPLTLVNTNIIQRCAQLNFFLLYPMSGILAGVSADTEETILPEGRINLLLGQGQTAQVLRNICYKVCELDKQNGTKSWDEIRKIINRMFLIELGNPEFDVNRGALKLSYKQDGMSLDIALAGRGFQQMLLLLAYAYWHKNSVLLIDEPDAHFEILRQKQAFIILKEMALRNGCQIIIATHSEVIIDEAVDVNLNLIINGEVVDLAQRDDIKKSLRQYGISHYYNAKVMPRVLYIEGSSDVDILRIIAGKISHPAINVLNNRLNCYYTQNISPEFNLETQIELTEGMYKRDFKPHFFTLKRFVPELVGLGIFDSDNAEKQDEINGDLYISYWNNYEIENHAISIDLISRFIQDNEMPLLLDEKHINQAIDEALLEYIFNGNMQQLVDFKSAKSLQKTILSSIKMSGLVDLIFRKYASINNQSIMINKGEYYKIVETILPGEVDSDIIHKLDLIAEKLSL